MFILTVELNTKAARHFALCHADFLQENTKFQGGPGTEPEPETGTVRTVFPETESGTGTAGTVFQKPKTGTGTVLSC